MESFLCFQQLGKRGFQDGVGSAHVLYADNCVTQQITEHLIEKKMAMQVNLMNVIMGLLRVLVSLEYDTRFPQ